MAITGKVWMAVTGRKVVEPRLQGFLKMAKMSSMVLQTMDVGPKTHMMKAG
ncbi:TetR/AcrR family transcriptional regulator [Sesbania bispinosa]|nr:TetR/AcrR family transcriptional regulator [Sesbania bispinosa]